MALVHWKYFKMIIKPVLTSRLIILLGLLVGVLYSLHILAQDYQAITAPKLLRLLFKRDLNSTMNYRTTVRWNKILKYDSIQCSRLFYCYLGAQNSGFNNELRNGFTSMLALKTTKEDEAAREIFRKAFFLGTKHNNSYCRITFPLCPLQPRLLLISMEFLLGNSPYNINVLHK